jgi:hypothetical protein
MNMVAIMRGVTNFQHIRQ